MDQNSWITDKGRSRKNINCRKRNFVLILSEEFPFDLENSSCFGTANRSSFYDQ
jgi:hypothetical protein